ncbi:MAG: DUF1207 domain-containing protein [Gemmatimonadota bacterium]
MHRSRTGFSPRRAAAPILIAALGAAAPAPRLAAQESAASGGTDRHATEWFPDALAIAPLIAAPREVNLGAGLVFANREDSVGFTGTNLEARVAIGHRLPVARFQREENGRPEVVLGFEVGVFSRFFMEAGQKDLIDSDFRVGAPLSLRRGAWDARLEILHVSSHLGDDFLSRFPRRVRQVFRNGLEALLARRLGRGVRAYIGADYNFSVARTVERTAGRAGLEWDPGSEAGEPAIQPFAAVNFEITSLTDRVASTGAAGLSMRVSDVRFRLDLRAHTGPSALGQLRTVDEDFLGLNLRGEFRNSP